MKSKIILVTGGAGFIGTWLAKEAQKAGYELLGIDLRAPLQPQIWKEFAIASLETVDFEQILRGKHVHAVLHLAGGASVPASVMNPYADFASLLPGTARLSIYLARFQPQARLYFFSSAAVYGNPPTMPIMESTPQLPISPYGIHKATGEMLLTEYARVFGLRLTILRIFSVYGPELRKQLIWDVSQKALAAVEDGEDHIVLFGTGYESRDFIHIKDLCRAILAVMSDSSNSNVEIFNLASGIETTVKEVAECLVRHLNLQVNVIFNGVNATGDPLNWNVNITKLRRLGFQPAYNIESGLLQVATWVRSVS